ncbi:SrfA family protein [Halopseudomonas yangmingensis]|uniref:Virulence factor n=1 Tax=Halopseudomonas yangmingensis TaxID=1720063 RepID=A0A1I4P7A5_9GAMM|nr:SrfA family protein [Halopseudomonas yangmingensis]SFM23470.1 hypothetical protein SAMN05216217_102151 [Halopseudomonas yangmingensis]
MLGTLLRNGSSDEFIALGETGQPVYKAALQIIAALSRKQPELAHFLAVPKSNDQGTRIDWYSPLPGDVIPWASATEDERGSATSALQSFKQSLASLSQSLISQGGKSGQGDQVIFGKLLGLVAHCPDANFIYLVSTESTSGLPHLQPVLSFWGFVHSEPERLLDPLYFLAPRQAFSSPPASPVTANAPASLGSQATATVQTDLAVIPVTPWWRRLWWLLLPLLLLLLLLLMFGPLRGCLPSATPGFGIPGVSTKMTTLPSVDVHANPGTGMASGPARPTTLAQLPAADVAAGGSAAPAAEPPAATEPPANEPQNASDIEAEAPTEAAETNAAPPQQPPAPTEPPQPMDPPAPPLSIPADAAQGPADFLNGSYRAGAGIQDRRTGKPLRLEYQFQDGRGNVTVQRPDGVNCSGAVAASMQGAQLAIRSEAQAACADGSRYEMPDISCTPGTQNIADCTGSYGSENFPMSMRQVGE